MSTKINKTVPFKEHATFAVESDLIGAHKYQWFADDLPVGHGNDKTYTTPPLQPGDFKKKFTVTVWGQNATETSEPMMIDGTKSFDPPAKELTGVTIIAPKKELVAPVGEEPRFTPYPVHTFPSAAVEQPRFTPYLKAKP